MMGVNYYVTVQIDWIQECIKSYIYIYIYNTILTLNLQIINYYLRMSQTTELHQGVSLWDRMS